MVRNPAILPLTAQTRRLRKIHARMRTQLAISPLRRHRRHLPLRRRLVLTPTNCRRLRIGRADGSDFFLVRGVGQDVQVPAQVDRLVQGVQRPARAPGGLQVQRRTVAGRVARTAVVVVAVVAVAVVGVPRHRRELKVLVVEGMLHVLARRWAAVTIVSTTIRMVGWVQTRVHPRVRGLGGGGRLPRPLARVQHGLAVHVAAGVRRHAQLVRRELVGELTLRPLLVLLVALLLEPDRALVAAVDVAEFR